MSEVTAIPTDRIEKQTLERPDASAGLEALCESIRQIGILNPLLVVKRQDKYYLVAGRRRLLSARALKLPTVPCLVLEADQTQALAMSLHENLYRDNLTAMDEAILYSQLRVQFHYTNRQVCEVTGKKESYVSQRLAVMDWPSELQRNLASGQISFSIGRCLAQVDDPKHMLFLLKHAVADGSNARTVDRWVKDWQADRLRAEEPLQQGGPVQGPEKPKLVATACSWCGRTLAGNEIRWLALCQDDLNQFMEVREAARAEQSEPADRPP